MKNKSYHTNRIAWHINGWFWLDKLTSYFWLDLFILAMLAVGFLVVHTGWEGLSGISDLNFTGNGMENAALQLKGPSGIVETYPLLPWLKAVFPFLAVICLVELLDLFGALFRVRRIRRQLQPLEDLITQAEAISAIPIDSSNYEALEQAIRAAGPDAEASDARVVHVHSGDGNLSSIENAINNLLDRMQESNRQQVRFVSDASHELRTPIAVIQGYADLLDRWGKEDPAILQEGISSIKNESQHMKDLVEQLLFLARGDSGRNILHPAEVDLQRIAEEITDEFTMIDEKHSYRLKPGSPAVTVADEGMVKQSMRIFVQNAAKYSPEGSAITLSTEADERTVSYSISDEGKGMAGAEVGHIFERFYRTDDTRNSRTGGTGLGLSIAKWIVDAHKGEISVVTREGIGSRFTVRLPKQAQTMKEEKQH